MEICYGFLFAFISGGMSEKVCSVLKWEKVFFKEELATIWTDDLDDLGIF